MMKFFFSLPFFLLSVLGCCAQELFQLAPPRLIYPSVFFSGEITVAMEFRQPGTAIHYTTNGKEPGTTDPVYNEPVRVDKNFTTITARVFGEGVSPSEPVTVVFIKEGYPLQAVTGTRPKEKYSGKGKDPLMDNLGGIPFFTSGTWVGFDADTVTLLLQLKKKEKVKELMLHLLQDQGAWIFFPQAIEVETFETKTASFRPAGHLSVQPEEGKDINVMKPVEIIFPRKIKTDRLRVKMVTLKLPAWHPGSGQKSWVFIDEIKVY